MNKYTALIFFLGTALAGQGAYADQINALRFKQALSSDAFYVEDGLDGRRGLGREYKGTFSLTYESADSLIPVVKTGGEEKIQELVENFQRLRLTGGYFVLPALFIGVTIPYDNVEHISPFDPNGNNPDLDSLGSTSSGWVMGDVSLALKYRLFNLRDSWNWTLTSSVIFPTGEEESFNTDDSVGGSIGLSFSKYLSPASKYKVYGNLSYIFLSNSSITISDQFNVLDAKQRLGLAVGLNYRHSRRWGFLSEIATQMSFPFDEYQNPLAINLGANYYLKRFVFFGGVGLESFLDEDHSENRFFVGMRYLFSRRKNAGPEGQSFEAPPAGNQSFGRAGGTGHAYPVYGGSYAQKKSELLKLLQVARRIHFQTGRDKIIPIYNDVLDRAIALMHQLQGQIRLIKIEGHTDSRGESGKNMELSKLRAQAVRDYFVQKGGLPESLFEVSGKGSQQPLVEEVDLHSQRLNRRVEFYVYEAE